MPDFRPAFQIYFILEESTYHVLLHSGSYPCEDPKSFNSHGLGNGGELLGWSSARLLPRQPQQKGLQLTNLTQALGKHLKLTPPPVCPEWFGSMPMHLLREECRSGSIHLDERLTATPRGESFPLYSEGGSICRPVVKHLTSDRGGLFIATQGGLCFITKGHGLQETGELMLLFSCSDMSDSLRPHGLQHARLPCPSFPRACSDSCPLSR